MTATGEGKMTTPTEDPGNLVQRIVRWLRAGYPDGVPQQDYVALLGILRRSLTDSELAQVVERLTDEAEAGQQILTRQLVEQRIEDVVKGPIDEGDAIRVSARLAAAGWPLGSPLHADDGQEAAEESDRPGLVGRVVDWLRAGYPSGLPDQDYVPAGGPAPAPPLGRRAARRELATWPTAGRSRRPGSTSVRRSPRSPPSSPRTRTSRESAPT